MGVGRIHHPCQPYPRSADRLKDPVPLTPRRLGASLRTGPKGENDDVVEHVLPDAEVVGRGRRNRRPGCPHEVLVQDRAARPAHDLPPQLGPERQRPPSDLDGQVTEPALLPVLGRAEDRAAQHQAAGAARRVLERLPPGVGRVRLGPVCAHPRQRLGDQVRSQVGHPAQQDEAELPPRQPSHPAQPATEITPRSGDGTPGRPVDPRVTPRTVASAFRTVAIAEALSWIGLLAGMFVKHVLRTSELGVQVFGPVHGAVFVAYVVLALVAGRVLRWPAGTTVLALAASVPPLATVWFERLATRNDRLPRQQAVPAA
jgi:integral membrane protein